MKCSAVAASLLAVGMFGLANTPAEAQKFPSHLRNCHKREPFERVEAEYSVPVATGGAGLVRVVSQSHICDNTYTDGTTTHVFNGMKDASGKLIIPFKYAQVLPFSTTGALVINHGDGPHSKNLRYRTYIAGKGEGKEQFDFQEARMLVEAGGCGESLTAPVGELWFGVGGGKSHVTLFTPSGAPRKLDYMGGDDLDPAVQRVGDVLLARWRDGEGVVRSGILDFTGRQIAPVLGKAVIWSSLPPAGRVETVNCRNERSLDLFIEGPSLDREPSEAFYGPLLTLVGRDGLPADLPAGAVGMFPAIREGYKPNTWGHAGNTNMWAVVFPTQAGFEFTLHLGTPTEALAAAPSAPRFDGLDRTTNGYVMARAVADKRWRVYRPHTDLVVGEPDTDPSVALANASVIVAAEVEAEHQALAHARAVEESARVESEKRWWAEAKQSGRICPMQPAGLANERLSDYLEACGLNQPGLLQLARERAISETVIAGAFARAKQRGLLCGLQIGARATSAEAKEVVRTCGPEALFVDPATLEVTQDDIRAGQRAAEAAQREAQYARAAELERLRGNSSYVPGQWESAIRNAGDAWVAAINESSDHWLKQRQDQYNADWQRSQRAY